MNMRRLVVEIPVEEITRFEGAESMMSKVKSAEVLHFLRYDQKEFAMIIKMRFKDGVTPPPSLLEDNEIEMQLLEERGGAYTYFAKCKARADFPDLGFFSSEGYFTTPFEVSDGRLRLSFMGNVPEMKRFLDTIEQAGVRHKIVSVTDAKFLPNSPLGKLTDRQRKVLNTAYDLGYYDRPRRISSKRLAKNLNLASSTLVSHRLKAERNLIAAVLQRS